MVNCVSLALVLQRLNHNLEAEHICLNLSVADNTHACCYYACSNEKTHLQDLLENLTIEISMSKVYHKLKQTRGSVCPNWLMLTYK